MKKITILFLLFTSWSLLSQKKKVVDISQLIKETQINKTVQNKLHFCWWIPYEFWSISLTQNGTVPQEQIDYIVKTLKPYSLFAIAEGTISNDGNISYLSNEQIVKNLKLFNANNITYTPIPKENINPDILLLLNNVKPMLKNMLGKMGSNIQFYVFQDYDNHNNRITNPYVNNHFTVKTLGKEYEFELPLSSLLTEKKCPIDNKLLNGTWTYCPWHGEVLTSK